MIEAFKQEAWCYGKIDDCHEMNKTGLADLEIKFGYQWLKNDCCSLSHLQVCSPAQVIVQEHTTFLNQSLVLHKHVGGEVGMTGVFQFWESCNGDYVFSFALDMNAWYFAEGNERRSFDLNIPWSRYMQTYANRQQAHRLQIFKQPIQYKHLPLVLLA